MKATLLLLTLSLAANAALAFLYLRRPVNRVLPSGTVVVSPSSRPTHAATESITLSDPALRDAIARRDPKALLAALRAAGFPENYVRDIVMWEIGTDKSPARLALLEAEGELAPWDIGPSSKRPALREASAELARKSQAKTSEVFDGRTPPHPLQADRQRQRYGFLPGGKIEAVSRIDSDYAELTYVDGKMAAPDVIRVLDQERRADLARVLSPAELELYDLYLSTSAQALRRELGAFQPTEEEFRALYAVRRAADEKEGRPPYTLGAFSVTTLSDGRHLEPYRGALSPDRFAEFQRGQDLGYRAAIEIANHYKLPANVPTEVYALQQEAIRRLRERPAPGTDPAARQAALIDFSNKASDTLVRLLGEPGADAYRRVGGTWLRSLESAAGRPPPSN